ncbi:MAG: 4Fe-4S dicluster domain-containing protein [Planctomycetota bacterium]|jgi:ferredoxin
MRLDIFLPFLKRPKAGDEAPRPGLLRRALEVLGPSWLRSPVRRTVQTVCLVLFCFLFFWVAWPYGARPGATTDGWASHYTDDLAAREWLGAETFLVLDPLVSISTAVAARAWVWSLPWAGAVLIICLVFPRGFCGHVCPLGTLIDIFDSAVGRHVRRWNVKRRGWWTHLRYYVLAGVLAAALSGVMLSGFAAAIPVLTRGLQFSLAPLQTGLMRGWHQVPPMNAGQLVSLALFAGVFALGLLGRRFWCRHLCPTGALFSVGAVLARVTGRRVDDSCTRCGRCVAACSFGAVRPDFTTRVGECTFCQACGGACPARAISFVGRWEAAPAAPQSDEPLSEGPLSDAPQSDAPLHDTRVTRRGLLAGALSGLAAGFGVSRLPRADASAVGSAGTPVRPPGSVPEGDFLRLCVRCGECLKACPNNVLQPQGFAQGMRGLWTPRVAADWSGCDPSCANCGQVCPTGAIRALPLSEKRVARMGLAVVRKPCLPWAGREPCRLCAAECEKAGYGAIEFERVGVRVDEDGMPVPESGFSAPVVVAERCVGCGLCQTICRLRNVKTGKLAAAAIVVEAGPGREDRILTGRYTDLRAREAEARAREEERRRKEFESKGLGNFYR